ncbi:hypothetical protein [Aeromicrobium sp. NPDC092404]|uniref:hypothetical protein n=1 Tax=Aeromicrobium sp. NPDC092404 TaxID=3154976 RepID=UPI00341DB372
MDPVQEVLDAITRSDWDRVRVLVHPYVHWTHESGLTTRARTKALAELTRTPARPAEIELRDGQIYRWISVPHD